MAAAEKWQDVRCGKCDQLLTDPRKALLHHDVLTGALAGVHMICPAQQEASEPQENPDYMRGWNDAMAYAGKAITALELPLLKPKGT